MHFAVHYQFLCYIFLFLSSTYPTGQVSTCLMSGKYSSNVTFISSKVWTIGRFASRLTRKLLFLVVSKTRTSKTGSVSCLLNVSVISSVEYTYYPMQTFHMHVIIPGTRFKFYYWLMIMQIKHLLGRKLATYIFINSHPWRERIEGFLWRQLVDKTFNSSACRFIHRLVAFRVRSVLYSFACCLFVVSPFLIHRVFSFCSLVTSISAHFVTSCVSSSRRASLRQRERDWELWIRSHFQDGGSIVGRIQDGRSKCGERYFVRCTYADWPNPFSTKWPGPFD